MDRQWVTVPTKAKFLRVGDHIALEGWTDGFDPAKEEIVLEVCPLSIFSLYIKLDEPQQRTRFYNANDLVPVVRPKKTNTRHRPQRTKQSNMTEEEKAEHRANYLVLREYDLRPFNLDRPRVTLDEEDI